MRNDSLFQPYLNLSGDSGVRGYAIGPQAIAVEFADGSVYLYTDDSAGTEAIARMHELARSGRGLNTYINRCVRDAYAQRLR
jgi:hypothetical protein